MSEFHTDFVVKPLSEVIEALGSAVQVVSGRVLWRPLENEHVITVDLGEQRGDSVVLTTEGVEILEECRAEVLRASEEPDASPVVSPEPEKRRRRKVKEEDVEPSLEDDFVTDVDSALAKP